MSFHGKRSLLSLTVSLAPSLVGRAKGALPLNHSTHKGFDLEMDSTLNKKNKTTATTLFHPTPP